MSTAVLLQQHQLASGYSCDVNFCPVATTSTVPVMTGRSTAVLLQQHQLISGYSWEVNWCPIATTSTDTRL